MLEVVCVKEVSAPVSTVWRYLTEPDLIAQWFADCTALGPSAHFRFEFGDGDFFAGDVRVWVPPRHLGLTWRFMDVGPRYDIDYELQERPASTAVSVRDRGALTPEEASSLWDGWTDFLERLRVRVETCQPARYLWSPTISAGAFVQAGPADVLAALHRRDWWRAAFPDVPSSPRATAHGPVTTIFQDVAWGDSTTTASVSAERLGAGTYVAVVHVGWEHLDPARQQEHRRRYAVLWARALRGLEAQFGAAAPGDSAPVLAAGG